MKKFQFRLDSVLRLKAYELDQAQNRLNEQEELLRSEQLVLRDMQAHKRNLREQRRGFQKLLDFTMMEIVQKCEEEADFRITSQELKLVDIHKELTQRREAVKTARRHHRMYEKLKQKAFEQYRKERLDYEQDFLDEISVLSAGRKAVEQ